MLESARLEYHFFFIDKLMFVCSVQNDRLTITRQDSVRYFLQGHLSKISEKAILSIIKLTRHQWGRIDSTAAKKRSWINGLSTSISAKQRRQAIQLFASSCCSLILLARLSLITRLNSHSLQFFSFQLMCDNCSKQFSWHWHAIRRLFT